MRPTRTDGLTLVEVLVATAIMGILLAFVAAFFAQQSRHGERLQATTEARAKARTIGEIVAQDLELAGSTTTVSGGAPIYLAVRGGGADASASHSCSSVYSQGCIDVHDTTGLGLAYWSTLWYRSSLDAGACHRVDYAWDPALALLYRVDVADSTCPSTTGDPTFGAPNAFAHGVTSFSVTFICDDGTPSPDPAACYAPPTTAASPKFVRSAHITLSTVSENLRQAVSSEFDLDAPTPNLRPPVDYGEGFTP